MTALSWVGTTKLDIATWATYKLDMATWGKCSDMRHGHFSKLMRDIGVSYS